MQIRDFQNRISRGQEKLAVLLGSQPVTTRKRGRPRKSEALISEAKQEQPSNLLAELTEPRSKRCTRVPVRFTAGDFYHDAGGSVLHNFDVQSEFSASKEQILEPSLLNLETLSEIQTLDLDVAEPQNGHSTAMPDDLNPILMEDETFEDTFTQESDSDDSVNLGNLTHGSGRGKRSGKSAKRGRPRSSKRQVFKCSKCTNPSVFTSRSLLMYHELITHGSKRDFQCPICKETFLHKALLANHMFSSHSSGEGFTCDVPECNLSFKNA